MQSITIPEITITLPDGKVCNLKHDLNQLNWNWEHPRIQIFLNRCAERYKSPGFTLENIPYKVLARLAYFINLVWQCEQAIKILKIDWSDPQVSAIFKKWGINNEMTLAGWEDLLKHLDKRWFETGDIAF